MRKKHTKAPWEAARRGAYRDMNGQSVVILGNDGGGDGGQKRLCVVHHHKTPEDDANVALIVAAPRLLKALREASRALMKLDPLAKHHDAVLIDDVLREAKGIKA